MKVTHNARILHFSTRYATASTAGVACQRHARPLTRATKSTRFVLADTAADPARSKRRLLHHQHTILAHDTQVVLGTLTRRRNRIRTQQMRCARWPAGKPMGCRATRPKKPCRGRARFTRLHDNGSVPRRSARPARRAWPCRHSLPCCRHSFCVLW